MDPLSDLLRVVRLDGAFFFAVEAADPWSVDTLPARELSPRIMPASEHLISYHIVTAGHCFGGVAGDDQIELDAGDVLVFPHGHAHLMSSRRGVRVSPHVNSAAMARFPQNVIIGAGGAHATSFLCGFLGCDRRPFNPLLASLPRQIHLRGLSNTWLGGMARQLTDESRSGRAGATSVLTRLAEVMFIEVLRRYLDELPSGQTGWLAGLRDETVGRVLTQIHSRPGHPWTLEELAHEAGSSRSSVASRFTSLVGQPPMQYLTQWRMQVAATLLAQGGAKVATVGSEVGYDSEAAFSRAFKKSTGLAPGAWRKTRRALSA